MSKVSMPQKPAEGIAIRGNWPQAKQIEVMCGCGVNDHNHSVWIEAENNQISVTIYTQAVTRTWQTSRWRIIWHLLTKGYTDYEASITMSSQQALNYAGALQSTVIELEKSAKTNK